MLLHMHAGHEHEAERHAVATLVALTLKLSEAKFKPMFLRLLEWANNPLPGTSAAPIGRVITLFAAASALSEKLRSVFVPYFKYLLDLAVKHLGGASATAVGQRKSKKAKKGGEEADASSGGVSEVDAWVLRGRVVRALHRCFLYDTVNFIDQDKVDRLLPPLVAQLSVAPPSAESAAAVTAQCGDAELDSVVTFGPRTPRDTYGTAVVAALVQLAITANSDVHWKPLNRQVRYVILFLQCLASVQHLCSIWHLFLHLWYFRSWPGCMHVHTWVHINRPLVSVRVRLVCGDGCGVPLLLLHHTPSSLLAFLLASASARMTPCIHACVCSSYKFRSS
jgi:hypothetical protein